LFLNHTASAGDHAEHGERIDAEQQPTDQRYDNRTGADSAATQPKSAARTSAILDVTTLAITFPLHFWLQVQSVLV
jgi:hypothetical protein